MHMLASRGFRGFPSVLHALCWGPRPRVRALTLAFALAALTALVLVPAAGAHARRYPAGHAQHSVKHHRPWQGHSGGAGQGGGSGSQGNGTPGQGGGNGNGGGSGNGSGGGNGNGNQGGHPGYTPPTYLALGDSLAFGYSKAKFESLKAAGEPAAAYDTGYVDDFARALAFVEPGVQVVNDGCPGETTESFIHGPCEYSLAYPLHHAYAGGTSSSQLSDALAVIAAHPGAVNPITIDIGANDALGVIEETCDSKAPCIEEHAPALFAHIAANLGYILAQLHAAAPSARIIVLGLYNPFGETIPGADALTAKLNELESSVAAGVGARFADPLPLFDPSGALEAPTICLLTNMCFDQDIHPTDLGYAVLGGLVLKQYLEF
jgi:lysophospholipase L1-like esterase